jgi:hypothetical protein
MNTVFILLQGHIAARSCNALVFGMRDFFLFSLLF